MHGTFENLGWTTERVDQLKLLAAARFSAAQIGRELNITRNAVIGKANRIGVQINSSSPSNFRVRREVVGPRMRKRVALRATNTRTSKIVPADAPASLNRTIIELRVNECRYCVTGDRPFLFCGQPTDEISPYCAHHHFRVVRHD